MDARTPSPLADLSLVVRATPLAWVVRPDLIAAQVGIRAVCLDYSSPVLTSRFLAHFSPELRVDALWLGTAWSDAARSAPFQAVLRHMADELSPRYVVIDLDGITFPGGGSRQVAHQLHLARRVFGPERALLVRPRNDWLSGGRRHLVDLTALRHVIEEWDAGAALALDRPYDPTWEAEAAILRLGNRLRLLRLPTAAANRHAVGLDRVSARAMTTAIEQSRPPMLAFVPSVPLPLRPWRRAQRDELERAVTAVTNFGARLRADRAAFLSRGRGPNVRS